MVHFVWSDHAAHLIRNHAHRLLAADSLMGVHAATRLAQKPCLNQLLLLRCLLLLHLRMLVHLRNSISGVLLALLRKVCLQVCRVFVLTDPVSLLLHSLVLLFVELRRRAVRRQILYVLLILILEVNWRSHHVAHRLLHALGMLCQGF